MTNKINILKSHSVKKPDSLGNTIKELTDLQNRIMDATGIPRKYFQSDYVINNIIKN